MYKKCLNIYNSNCIYINFFLKMKLCFVILITAFLQLAGASTYGQKFDFSKKNVTLKHILHELESKTGYNFIYNSNVLPSDKLISVELKNATINEILDKSLENQPLSYTINGNTIVIVKKEKPATQQQQRPVVKGKVTNANNEPLSGVVVNVKGTNIVEQTNASGEYTIRANDAKNTLVFTLLGYKSTEVVIGDRRTINVSLQQQKMEVEEVVVTALGIKREEKSLGYSVTKVSGDELMDAVSNNWTDALSGKVAGLNLIKSGGGPAGTNKIILRGESSLSGNNAALIVVDGVVVNTTITEPNGAYLGTENPIDHGNGLSDLNPEDIESVSVLKGPGAAALYGSRGSNGAIIITTKAGKPAQKGLGISFNSNSTFGFINRWPDFQYEYGQGAIGNDRYYSYGATEDGSNTRNTSAAWGPKFAGQEYYQFDPNVLGRGAERTPWVPYKNNRKDFFDIAQTFTNSISISGGNARTTSRLSYTNLQNKWIVPNTGYSRNTLALNVSQKVNDKLEISTKMSYINKSSDNLPSTGYNNQTVMYNILVLVPNADLNWYKKWWKPGREGLEQIRPFSNGLDNIFLIVNEMLNASNRNQLIGAINATYQFNNNLNLMVRTSTDWASESRSQKRPKDTARFPDGMYRTQDIDMMEVNADFLLNYKRKLSSAFESNFSFGGSYMINRYKMIGLSADRLRYPGVYTFANRLDRVTSTSTTKEYATSSLYGMAQFSYNDYLFLDITGRNDWASVLASENSKNNISFFYPSVNLSAAMNEILNLPRKISFWKLRASYSQVGGGGVTPYLTSYNYVSKEAYPSGMANPTYIANPNLKNELSKTIEVGTDFRMFNSRLGIDATYYVSNVHDQILRVPVDRATGYSYIMMNSGEIQNKGFELQISGTPVKVNKGLTWEVAGNFSTNRNKVISLADSVSTYLMQSGPRGTMEARVGGRMGDLYGLGYKRNPEGKIIYNAQGYPTLTEDILYLGNATPDFTWGFTNTFKYKQFRLKVLVDGQYGAVAYSHTHVIGSTMGKLKNTLPGRYNGIIGDGVQVNPDGTYRPNDVVAEQIGTYYNEHFKSDNVEANTFSTDFIKLREVRFDYTLPAKFLKKSKLQRAVIGVYGRDLFIWSDWPAYDPEFGTLANSDIQRGFEVAQFPSTRNFGLNLTVSF